MKLSDKIRMAFADIINRKFRSFLTILAISVGSLLLIVMMGLGDGISAKFDELLSSFARADEISILPIDQSTSMGTGVSIQFNEEEVAGDTEETQENIEQIRTIITEEDVKKVVDVKGVDYVLAIISSNISSTKIGDGDYVDKSVNVTGVNLDYCNDFSKDLVKGKGFSKNQNENEVLVTEKYLKKMDIKDKKDVIGKTIDIKLEMPVIEGQEAKEPLEIRGKIVGVLGNDAYFNSGIVMSSNQAENILSYMSGSENYIEENGYSSLSAFVDKKADIKKVSNAIMKETGYFTVSIELMRTMVKVVTNVVKALLSIGGIIVLVVAALGLVNTMTMTLQEKRKMIGVMRSVGASKGKIRIIFIFQSIMLGLSGGIFGTILAGLVILVANKIILIDSSFKLQFTVNNIIISIILTLIISLLAGLIPSGRAARLNVVEAVAEE